MKAICKYIVFKLFIYSFNTFNIDAKKPFSGALNKVYVCMYIPGWAVFSLNMSLNAAYVINENKLIQIVFPL